MKKLLFFFSSRRRHTRCSRDWSSDVCSSDLLTAGMLAGSLGDRKSSMPSNPHSWMRENSGECRSLTCVVHTMVFTPYFMSSILCGHSFGLLALKGSPTPWAVEPVSSFPFAPRLDWVGSDCECSPAKQ